MTLLKQFSEKYKNSIFTIVFVIISLYYGQHQIITKPPMGIHRWRQADCASFALNYFQNGMNFFKPELHQLSSDNSKTGYGVSEAPILYYFIAFLYRIFGFHDSFFRIINLIITFLGLFYLFKLSQLIIKNTFYSLIIPFIFYTSPVFIYYSSNFLTDITAISLIFAGWFYFICYITNSKKIYLYLSLFIFLVSGLLKITTAINFIAVFCIFLYEFLFIKKQNRIIKHPLTFFAISLTLSLIVFSYYLWVIRYNSTHNTNYFNNRILPIWILDKEGIKEIWLFWKEGWWKEQFFNNKLIFSFVACLTFVIIYFKKLPYYFKIILIILFAGSLSYLLLWFSQFKYHDYYTLVFMSFVYFLLIFFFRLVQLKNEKILNAWLPKIIAIFAMLYLINFAKKEIFQRYYGFRVEEPKFTEYFSIQPYIRSIGINETDTVISIPDWTNCYTLYLMNRKGYNEVFGNNQDSASIVRSINLGAKYLFVNTKDYLEKDYLKPFLKEKAGEYGDVSIYRLTKNKKFLYDE